MEIVKELWETAPKIVIEQSQMAKQAEDITYQEPFPLTVRCKRTDCSSNEAMLIMLVHDSDKALVAQRPKGVRVWPHDSSVIAIYLCTECGYRGNSYYHYCGPYKKQQEELHKRLKKIKAKGVRMPVYTEAGIRSSAGHKKGD